MAASDNGLTGGETTPRPDPTAQTDAAITKAVAALRDYIDGQDEVLAERMAGHWRLDDERWKTFGEAQRQLAAERKDAATARDLATEKAIDKSESATAEAIGKLEQLFKTTTDALRDKIDDVKTTANATVQQKVGGTENRTAIFAVIGIVVTIALAVLTVVSFALAKAP